MINIIFTILLLSDVNASVDPEQGLLHSKSSKRYEVDSIKKESEDILGVFGKLRTAYIYIDEHTLGHDTNYATSIGGQFGVNTTSYEGFNLHLSLFTSVEVELLTGNDSHKNQEFFNEGRHSYVYVGEASLVYKEEGFEGMLGRIRIDTPYADSDDLRMSPNTFEGAWVYKELSQSLSTQVYYLSRMAGLDSSGSQDEFDSLYIEDGFGLVGASLDYHFADDNDISLWYYYVDKMSHIFYTEMNYDMSISENIRLTTAFQASSMIELDNSGVQGDVLGLAGVMHYKNLFFAGAYNYGFVDSNKQITDGFGGGAYYTSLDEGTIGAVSSEAIGEDVKGYRLGVGYESLFLDNLVVELIHGHLQSQKKTVDIMENNIVLSYQINDELYFELVGAKYKEVKNDNKFERLIVRFDYSF